MDFKHPASPILWSYLGFLDRIYGMYGDACSGVELFRKKIEDATRPENRNAMLFIGSGEPNNDDAKYKHKVKISEFIDRNKRDGENFALLAQSCVVFVYSVWDTVVRPQYAEAIDRPQKEVASDVFGDLRHYRHAIVHNNSVLEKKTRVLKFVSVGESITLTRAQMEEIFIMIFDAISDLNNTFVGEKFELKFERRLNPPSAAAPASAIPPKDPNPRID